MQRWISLDARFRVRWVMMRVRSINAVKLGSAIWMEMTRNGYNRFYLEGWSLSRVSMVVFGSGLTVGAISI
eukprot:scaffold84271_cov61-Attheya_sp.AAC.2